MVPYVFKIIHAIVPLIGGVLLLLIWLKVIPMRRDLELNKTVYKKYSKLIFVLTLILLLVSIDEIWTLLKN